MDWDLAEPGIDLDIAGSDIGWDTDSDIADSDIAADIDSDTVGRPARWDTAAEDTEGLDIVDSHPAPNPDPANN
jgi:hypothetical protein